MGHEFANCAGDDFDRHSSSSSASLPSAPPPPLTPTSAPPSGLSFLSRSLSFYSTSLSLSLCKFIYLFIPVRFFLIYLSLSLACPRIISMCVYIFFTRTPTLTDYQMRILRTFVTGRKTPALDPSCLMYVCVSISLYTYI